ncbi:hypothetical protein ACHWQZ_G003295 [Mnemiopsis leidyi]
MSSVGEEDIDIIEVDNEGENNEIKDCVASYQDESNVTMPVDSCISARTDGIRGPRYLDYKFKDSSGPESGELSDSDVDIVGTNEDKENEDENYHSFRQDFSENKTIHSNQKVTVSANSKEAVCHTISAKLLEPSSFASSANIEINMKTTEDLKGILGYIQAESPEHHTRTDGINKLMADHRQTAPVIEDSSDDGSDDLKLSESDSGDDSDYRDLMSLTSEVNRMEGMSIRDDYFLETFPEVEIIDLTLSESEEIILLGKVFKIVEDFVVVNSCCFDKVLDLDSMIFNADRKCIGYVFEVLGQVKEPYYSIRFNTNSDIEALGLRLNQELFYSPNERYSRYVIVDLLRELEYNSKQRRASDSGGETSSDNCNSGSEGEEIPDQVIKPKSGLKRKPKKQLQNRTTSNYSVNYQCKPVHKQPKHHYNSYVDQIKTVSYTSNAPTPVQQRLLPGHWQNHATSSQQHGTEAQKSTDTTSYDSLYSRVKRDQTDKAPSRKVQVNSFQSSVLASFLDPFSLDKPTD